VVRTLGLGTLGFLLGVQVLAAVAEIGDRACLGGGPAELAVGQLPADLADGLLQAGGHALQQASQAQLSADCFRPREVVPGRRPAPAQQ
jgi:hypothetical protein